jgi:membrane associated rhomboid family serine protease
MDATSLDQRAIRAPGAILAIAGGIVALHALRVALQIGADPFAFAASDLWRGRAYTLLAHMLVHANWAHVVTNAVFILAFGAPVGRLLGQDVRGAILVSTFFVVCGVMAALGFAGLDLAFPPGGQRGVEDSMIGASGAAAGLMGAASRLMGRTPRAAGAPGRPRLGPMLSRSSMGLAASWVVVNLVVGLTGLAPGVEGAGIAWQAHLVGFAVGLILIGPFARLAGAPRNDS